MIALSSYRRRNQQLIDEWREHEIQRSMEPPVLLVGFRRDELVQLAEELRGLSRRREVRMSQERARFILAILERIGARLAREKA